jgi:plastocyanin
MRWKPFANGILCAVALTSGMACAQDNAGQTAKAEARLRLSFPGHPKPRPIPAVVWLEPLEGTPETPFTTHGNYKLLQKNRMFTPHLLVVPVGSVVSFPNADPFFHNVFSLFDGKRFDLGLYEAGSSKEVPFTREGVSYIFCNIHPQMSAVVLTLSTPLYAVADPGNVFTLHDIAPGDYKLHLWVEGLPQLAIDQLGHRVHIVSGSQDLGEIPISSAPQNAVNHANKFGRPYDPDSKPAY